MDPKPKREDYADWRGYVNNYARWTEKLVKEHTYTNTRVLSKELKEDFVLVKERLFLVKCLLTGPTDSLTSVRILICEMYNEVEKFTEEFE